MTTARPAEVALPYVRRFDRAERLAHWAVAFLVVLLALTGLALSSSTLMALLGRRRTVELVHLAAGLALPLPVLVALAGRWGAGLRADVGRLNRFGDADRAWLRSTLRHRRRPAPGSGLDTGKFNAGQKLNAAFTVGAGLVMLGTGVIMFWFHPWPLAWRSGATTTHDWLAVALVVVAIGHVRFALADREALGSMRSGWVSRRWASAHAPAWLAEVDATGADQPPLPAPADDGR